MRSLLFSDNSEAIIIDLKSLSAPLSWLVILIFVKLGVGAHLFSVGDEFALMEVMWSILHESEGISRSDTRVEVEEDASGLWWHASSLSIVLVLVGFQEFLDIVDGCSSREVQDCQSRLEDGVPGLIWVSRHDALLDELNDLGSEDFGDATPIFPVHVGDRLATSSSISAHFQFVVLVDVHRKEVPLLTTQTAETARRFLQDHISERALSFEDEFLVLSGNLEGLLWVVLHLDASFIFLEVFAGAEGSGESFVSLVLPTVWSALQGWAIDDGFADGEHVAVSTFAVVAHLGLTRSCGTRLPRVAL